MNDRCPVSEAEIADDLAYMAAESAYNREEEEELIIKRLQEQFPMMTEVIARMSDKMAAGGTITEWLNLYLRDKDKAIELMDKIIESYRDRYIARRAKGYEYAADILPPLFSISTEGLEAMLTVHAECGIPEGEA